MMVRLLTPTSGSVWVGGVEVWKDPLRARSLMGVLAEVLNIYERLSGREFLVFAGHMYGIPAGDIRRRAEDLLQVLTLIDDADKLIVDYSVGMRKKTALAAALIHRPEVLFLDEPFDGIDPISSRVIRDIFRDLPQRGTTVFFFSHILEVLEQLSTGVASITEGTL